VWVQAGSRRFWPTRLALTLTSAATAAAAAAAETQADGFIVLETNFDLYAYTGPTLDGRLKARHPTPVLTALAGLRDSVAAADCGAASVHDARVPLS
jgi:transcription initiation factor TFIIH subunit 4